MIDFSDSLATRIPERAYFDFVLASVQSSRRRIWVSQFIFDVRPSRDVAGSVLEVALALVERSRAGVDVRVLLTGSVSTPDVAVANLATALLIGAYGVRQRRLFDVGADTRTGSHAKFAIWDDEAVIGSQNWTDDAFRLNLEDSVALSGQVVDVLADEFLRLWELGRGLPADATG
jgi:phosphatidylserine/phosphatidylglycerophosphate/cardiolipin synthase-like enzyme